MGSLEPTDYFGTLVYLVRSGAGFSMRLICVVEEARVSECDLGRTRVVSEDFSLNRLCPCQLACPRGTCAKRIAEDIDVAFVHSRLDWGMRVATFRAYSSRRSSEGENP
jgi:hypothetical protein